MGTVRLFGCLGAAAGLMACGGQTLTSATPDGGGGVDASVDASADVAPDTRPATLDAPIDTALPDTATADAPPDVLVSLDGGVNLAVHEVFLGDTDRNGTASQNAWQQYGMNLDGKVTTLSSTDVCMLAAGAPRVAQVDGLNGIDNSWGENILPIIETAAGSNFSTTFNAQIAAGAWTLMFDVAGLTADPNQTAQSTPAQLFVGSTFPGTPSWTAADNWPVDSVYLIDGQTVAGGSKTQFPFGSMMGGTWSSGAPVDFPFDVTLQGATMHLTIHVARVTFAHSAPTQAQMGVIAGVLDTNEFIQQLGIIVGRITNGSICPGSGTFNSIASQIQQAEDILLDGTNSAGVPCTGISIGLGFTADQIGPPQTVAPPPVQPPDPCAPPDAGPG
jgi:hypothetical protein